MVVVRVILRAHRVLWWFRGPFRSRRVTCVGVGLAVLALSGCVLVYDSIGGAFRHDPSGLADALSPGARALVEAAYEGIHPDLAADYHVHLLTRDVTPRARQRWRPFSYGRLMVYLSASGVRWSDSLEDDYLRRLLDLVRGMPQPSRYYVYGVDGLHDTHGTYDPTRTWLRVSNEHVMDVTRRYPDLFVPVVSIHPFRQDALDELQHWAANGSRHVKWLPNTMAFDPSDERLVPFYRTMIELDMVLLSHTGDEGALPKANQELGNPLRLRLPLDLGVHVVALHAASKGQFRDLDDPRGSRAEGFDLLLRMMDEPAYDERLYADISAMTFFNHLEPSLLKLLERPDLHHRFVNGSDYPFPAVRVAIRTNRLERLGFITAAERRDLDEIYHYNPLLFDFVVKRTIRHPVTGQRLREQLFEVPPAIR